MLWNSKARFLGSWDRDTSRPAVNGIVSWGSGDRGRAMCEIDVNSGWRRRLHHELSFCRRPNVIWFDLHIMASIVLFFELEDVGVMKAVTLFADVQRNRAALIAAAQNFNAGGRILFFQFSSTFYRARERLDQKYPRFFRRVCSYRVDLGYVDLDGGLPRQSRRSI